MSRIIKNPSSVNTTLDPGLEYIYNREKEVYSNPYVEKPTGNNVVIEQITQVVTNVIQHGLPSGSNGQLQFNQGGDFTSDGELFYDPITNTLTTGTLVIDGIVGTKQGIVSLGNIEKLKVGGGNYNEFLRTDGEGNLSFAQILPNIDNNQGKSLTVLGNNYYWSHVEYSTLANIPNNLATTNYVDSAISNVVGAAPGILDTLGELANALGNNNNYASMIALELANKANIAALSTVAFTGSYINLLNKPNIATVGLTGKYSDLIDSPNLDGFLTSNDLSNISNSIAAINFNANLISDSVDNLSSNLTSLTDEFNNVTANLGNISSLNLDGNSGNILYGNGVFAAAPSGGGGGLGDRLANSGYEVILDEEGALDLSLNGVVRNDGPVNMVSNVYTQMQYISGPVLGVDPNATSDPLNWVYVDGSGFTVETNRNDPNSGPFYTWVFDTQGNLSLPGSMNASGNIAIGGEADISGNVVIRHDLQVLGNLSFTGNVEQVSGNSGQFFGDVNGIGALYAGIPIGYSNVYNPVIQASASANDYVQINFQNINHGTKASTDWVATTDDGNDTQGYIDMGIAGGGWDGTQENSLGTALSSRDGYLYVQGGLGGGNLVLGAATSGTQIKFLVGGPNSGNIVANITSSGLYAKSLRGEGGNISNIQPTNITGLGNLALINKDGNASNVLYGNGVFAAAPSGGGTGNYSNSNVATYLSSGLSGSAPQIQLTNGTKNYIQFANAGVNAPTLSTSSSGTKLLLWSQANVSSADYAIGIESGSAWFSVPQNTTNFGWKWYGGATQVMALSGTGNLTLVGNITATNIGNVAALNKDGNASNVLYGNGVFAAAPITYTNSNVATFLSTGFGSNTITTTGNINSGNANLGNLAKANFFQGDGSLLSNITSANITGNIQGTSANVTITSGTYSTVFENNGNITLPNVGNVCFNGSAINGNFVFNPPGNGDVIFANNTQVLIQDSAVSTSTTSGALQVSGGAGIGGNLYVGGNVVVGNISIAASVDGPANGLPIDKLYWFNDGTGYAAGLQKRYGSMGGIFFRGPNTSFNVYANPTYGNNIPGDNAVFTVLTNGNIGVAQQNPVHTLDVTGNGRFTSNLIVGGTITGNLSGNVTGNLSGIVTGNLIGNVTGNTNGFAIGYRDIPQVVAGNATLQLTDAGKHYYSTTSGNLTLTIPNNATTSFSTGTAITIVVQAPGNVLVNASSGVTLYMAGNASPGNRYVNAYGMATLLKVSSDTWFINGTGVN